MTDISTQIWDGKYRLKALDGAAIDLTVSGTWSRVARALASVESDPDLWETKFYEILDSWEFIPAGRIIAGAGAERRVTLSNCFVMGTIPDSMDGIFSALREAALTMQQGGGIGYCFSTLRPKGAPVKGVGADASGPLSFMDVWDAMCRTIMSAGSRRGAMMATMHVWHPDIDQFIAAKADPKRLRNFNLSVLITDEFMEAVRHDREFRLHFEDKHGVTLVERWVSARELWTSIMQNTYDHAEPGVIFIDRINQLHNLNYQEVIAATNPCGEKPMAPYDSCLLGSINLTQFILEAFTGQARLNTKRLEEVTRIATRLMDNVIDLGQFPLEAQADKSRRTRQLGLGITGLADALVMLNVRYGSSEAQQITSRIMRIICKTAYQTSIALAQEKGPFPDFQVEGFLGKGTFAYRNLDVSLQRQIYKNGIRNSLLISIAPTGTISLFAGNVSSGIEPIFALGYDRKILNPDGSHRIERVEDWAVAEFRELYPNEPLPESFVTAETLTPQDHLAMQAAAQEWVDSSISKTINLPEDIAFEDFQDVYLKAYDLGCKGCTTYRPNAVTGSILSTSPKAESEAPKPEIETPKLEALTQRPKMLPGLTHKVKFGGEAALYITVTDIEEDGVRRPFEVFVNTKSPEHYAWTVALTRMISAIFRRGGDVSFVAEELKQVFDPKGGAWLEGAYVPSVPAALGRVLETHMRAIGYLTDPAPLIQVSQVEEVPSTILAPLLCVKCSSSNVTLSGGCPTCGDCGYSKCG